MIPQQFVPACFPYDGWTRVFDHDPANAGWWTQVNFTMRSFYIQY